MAGSALTTETMGTPTATTADRPEGPADRADGPAPSRIGYRPEIDGLRALAVSAVFLFHVGLVPGGFIGVDVFFVVSGFLITGLALVEIETKGRLALGRFWARRVRRLLPAAFALCAGVAAYWWIVGDPSRSVRRDILATVGYYANWTRIGAGEDYFATYREPSLLEHTWSLAVEEQFYLVWPVVLVVVVLATRERPHLLRPAVAAVSGLIAVLALAWTWSLVADGADAGRLYYGTDTRALGIAVGALAACALVRRPARGGAHLHGRDVGSHGPPPWAAVAGLLALGVLAALPWVLDGSQSWFSTVGLLAISVATVVVLAVTTAGGPIAAALRWGPLPAIGRRSYGLYLWHWPVIVVLDADATGLDGPLLFTVRVAVTFLLTEISWRLVETRAPLPTVERPARALAYGTVAIVVLAIGMATVPDDLTGELAAIVESEVVPVTGTTPDVTTPDRSPNDGPARSPDDPFRVLVLGDSVAFSLREPPPSLSLPSVGPVVARTEGIVGCSVFDFGAWAGPTGELLEDPDECVGPQRFDGLVADFDPDVIVVVFGWSGSGRRVLSDGEPGMPCEPDFDREWGAAFDTMVNRLATAAPVVVSTIAPYADGHIEPHDDRTACLNAELRRHDFSLYDYEAWMCPEGECSALSVLRDDGLHFTDDPAVREVVWPVVIDGAIAAAGVS